MLFCCFDNMFQCCLSFSGHLTGLQGENRRSLATDQEISGQEDGVCGPDKEGRFIKEAMGAGKQEKRVLVAAFCANIEKGF